MSCSQKKKAKSLKKKAAPHFTHQAFISGVQVHRQMLYPRDGCRKRSCLTSLAWEAIAEQDKLAHKERSKTRDGMPELKVLNGFKDRAIKLDVDCTCSDALASLNSMPSLPSMSFSSKEACRSSLSASGTLQHQIVQRLTSHDDPFQLNGFYCLQAMKFAIEEINNSSTLLPGVTLGYNIQDTCLKSSVAMQSAISFLTPKNGNRFEMKCDYTDHSTRVLAVLGPSTSELSRVITQLFSFLLVPQISYAASSNLFNDRMNFPSFYRTAPADEVQAAAMISIVETFQWNWMAVIGTDDMYGRKGIEHITQHASKSGICIAYEELIPLNLPHSKLQRKMESVIKNIVYSRVNVTAVFADEGSAKTLMMIILKHNVTGKVWIASEAWVISKIVAKSPNISSIGTILGVAFKSGHIPGFEYYISAALAFNHLLNLNSQKCGSDEKFLGEEKHKEHPTQSVDGGAVTVDEDRQRISFNVYSAVYTVSHALHRLLRCDLGTCTKSTVYPWQLLKEIPQVNFTLHSRTIFFDKNGNPPTGYDIINWQWKSGNSTPEFKLIGEYRAQDKKLLINASLINWNTLQNETPGSNCSTSCGPGQIKLVKGYHSCCYKCADCPAGTFQSGDNQCVPCLKNEWSLLKSVKCQKKTIEFLQWTDTVAILVASLAALSLLIIVAITGIFIINLNTPMVQLAGGTTCLVMLVSMAVSCCSLYCFIEEPNWLLCTIRQPIFSIGLTGCLSAMLVKSLQVSGLFRVTGCIPQWWPEFMRHNDRHLMVCSLFLLQIALCSVWQLTSPPSVFANYNISVTAIVMECDEGSVTGFGLMLVYNGLLALACFLCTFMVQSSAKNYNLARHITLAMLIYLMAWVFFIPAYTTAKGKFVSSIQLFTGLVSMYGIIAAYFLPKCYIILLKPEFNSLSYCQSPMDNPPPNSESQ
ncbi:taste receptor type 1 member 1-like [Carcharodon carcharias]|uniref:taste receptor type 1 member 1-like n=1 Tax=Carcharodon carcharias TaxID=13397 RepID=UPI001B7DBFCB|nr:taste receptor type 1 member 1-like [Carcharodon carcharias]